MVEFDELSKSTESRSEARAHLTNQEMANFDRATLTNAEGATTATLPHIEFFDSAEESEGNQPPLTTEKPVEARPPVRSEETPSSSPSSDGAQESNIKPEKNDNDSFPIRGPEQKDAVAPSSKDVPPPPIV
jgi:hypothetical protein